MDVRMALCPQVSCHNPFDAVGLAGPFPKVSVVDVEQLIRD